MTPITVWADDPETRLDPMYRQGWLDALNATLQLLEDVRRGIRAEEEVRPELEGARLRIMRGG